MIAMGETGQAQRRAADSRHARALGLIQDARALLAELAEEVPLGEVEALCRAVTHLWRAEKTAAASEYWRRPL